VQEREPPLMTRHEPYPRHSRVRMKTEISRTDRFRFLYYGSVFKHKKLSVSIGFTTIFNYFLYSLITKI
jgi:hypothetical protein